MLTLDSRDNTPEEIQQKLIKAGKLSQDEGMTELIQFGLIQLHRYMLRNIEVDTARTKNSLFWRAQSSPQGVWGFVGSNVKYSPYVRDRQHRRHFMVTAAEKEGPQVLARMGRTYALAVKETIER